MVLRLVFTTSIITPEREQIYIDCIRDTLSKLKHIPLKAYVVENNGERKTALDMIEGVEILYTNTNNLKALSDPSKYFISNGKGQKEMLDILLLADYYNFKDDDLVIKLTGRYTLASPSFFDYIYSHPSYDLYMKFWNVCKQVWDPFDCVMGLYACRYLFLKEFDYMSFGKDFSSERVLADYFRSTLAPEKICEIEHLDMYFQGDSKACI